MSAPASRSAPWPAACPRPGGDRRPGSAPDPRRRRPGPREAGGRPGDRRGRRRARRPGLRTGPGRGLRRPAAGPPDPGHARLHRRGDAGDPRRLARRPLCARPPGGQRRRRGGRGRAAGPGRARIRRRRPRGAAGRPAAAGFTGGLRPTAKRLEQAHLVMLLPALGLRDPDYFALRLFAEILGGGMSSRLFQEARERRGLAYAIDAYAETYADVGVLGVYAGCAAGDAGDLASVAAGEIRWPDRSRSAGRTGPRQGPAQGLAVHGPRISDRPRRTGRRPGAGLRPPARPRRTDGRACDGGIARSSAPLTAPGSRREGGAGGGAPARFAAAPGPALGRSRGAAPRGLAPRARGGAPSPPARRRGARGRGFWGAAGWGGGACRGANFSRGSRPGRPTI